MELSQRAHDILRALPRDSMVYSDDADIISVKLPRTAIVDDTALSHFGDCEIDFETRLLTISLHEVEPFSPRSPRPPAQPLDPVTTGETNAASMANTMGRIDFDNLVPSFRLSSVGEHTTLVIGRLLRVSNSALRQQLPSSSTHYEYRLQERVTVVFFPAAKKRKAE